MAVFEPIGIYNCERTYRYEAPRQGVFSGSCGVITLNSNMGFEEAASDLAGFSRIWIIFEFHLNETWRVKVRPPVPAADGRKIGVFATRSPHRPNRIGMSCVELEKVEGLKIFVKGSDLLDRTPVLDVKPYVPAADAFPDARTGWLEQAKAQKWDVVFDDEARSDIEFIRTISSLDIGNFCTIQLSLDPLSPDRKRIKRENGNNLYSIGCRTWRVMFMPDEAGKIIRVVKVVSNYTPDELLTGSPDKYGDKDFHRAFLARNAGKN